MCEKIKLESYDEEWCFEMMMCLLLIYGYWIHKIVVIFIIILCNQLQYI